MVCGRRDYNFVDFFNLIDTKNLLWNWNRGIFLFYKNSSLKQFLIQFKNTLNLQHFGCHQKYVYSCCIIYNTSNGIEQTKLCLMECKIMKRKASFQENDHKKINLKMFILEQFNLFQTAFIVNKKHSFCVFITLRWKWKAQNICDELHWTFSFVLLCYLRNINPFPCCRI